MVHFKLIVLMLGVLQVCTANPMSSEEEDPTKLFTADELKRATDAGLSLQRLVEGKSIGFTFEQMMQIHELGKSQLPGEQPSVETMYKSCQILDPEVTKATSFTSAQEETLHKLVDAINNLAEKKNMVSLARSTVCAYISQPDMLDAEANTFGLPIIPYLKMRYFTTQAKKSSGLERVKVAKQLCCLHNNKYGIVLLDRSRFVDLPDAQLNNFDELWNKYQTANTLTALDNVCDFIRANETDGDDCKVVIPVDLAVHA